MKSPHLDRDWLYQKYVVEGLSTYDIGKIVQRNPKRVYEKLVDFQIPTRPRGQNLKGADNYMNQPDAVNPFEGKKHTSFTKKLLSRLASKPKPHLRGEKNGMFGRRGDKNPHWLGGIAPERQAFYNSPEWLRASKIVMKRDKGICQRCKKSCKGHRDSQIHHIVPFSNKELRADPSNLITLCKSCHNWIHSKANTTNEFIG